MFQKKMFRLEESFNRNGNNIIKSMSTGRYAKTANRIKNSEIYPRDRTKGKFCPVKWIVNIRLAAEKIYMMMRTE